MSIDQLALDALKNHQRQLDDDGVEVGVSRQALDELITAYEAAKEAPKRIVRKDGEIVGIGPNPNHQPVGLSQTQFMQLMIEAGYNPDEVHPKAYENFSWSTVHNLLQGAPEREIVGWQPIETCPVDTKSALITGGTFRWDDGYEDCPMDFVALADRSRDGDWRAQANGHDAEYYYKPTHWQPVPNPPKSDSIEDGGG